MAKIAFMEDVIVPAGVGAVNIGLRDWDERRLTTNPDAIRYQPIAGIVGIGLGYVMQAFDMMPVVGNRVAVSSMPTGLTGIYDWIRAATTTPVAGGGRIAARRVGAGARGNPNPGGVAEDPLRRYRQGAL